MDPIRVESINFYPKENAKENHTEEYDLVNSKTSPTTILRRGENFTFLITFTRAFNEKTDVVRIDFSLGPTPNVSQGTKVVLAVLPTQKVMPPNNRWGLLITSIKGKEVTLKAHIPHTARIGIWKCSVQTNISGDKSKREDYTSEEELYIIFNPWCKEDQVYLANEKERKEFVLNETGKIWIGTFKEPKSKRWVFGQFDEVVLPATLFLLEKSNVAHGDRGSAVQIARAISALINSKDDDGLLEGKWDGEYADGVSPFDWSGSTAIMDAYLKSGGKPVKYGQCWVFSAVGVTICRALGIPCRSVTNYISAHDTNNSLTVDKFFDVFGNIIENGPQGDCNDSCWNFHVWNDVWMTRPDLPLGYDGWQVIDGTPQELSTNSNTYCCGPTSVKAVKKGDVGLVYDTPFVFSEVNADICNFQEDEESAWGFSRLSINRYHVGRRILTKQVDWYDDVGDSDMWDITSEYKNPEGSEAERLALQSAIRGVPRAQEHYNIPSKSKEDVVFDLIDIDTIPLGQRFEVVVHINNNSSETRTIATNMSASSVYYTGSTAHRLKSAQGTFIVKPGGKEILKLLVKPDDYIDKLTDHGFIKIYAIANVKETKQTWCEEDDFTFIKPELTVDIKDNIRIGENSTFYLRFKNPLNISLTDCKYTIEAAGLSKPKSENFRDVKPTEEVTISESLNPQLPGQRTLVATFSCKQIQGIGGPTPNVSQGTKVVLAVLPTQKVMPPNNRWGLLITSIKGKEVTLKAHIPHTARIGIWKCSVQTNISGDKSKREDYTSEEELYIIFNPWCKEDQVYLANEKERKEFVLNETGKIWIGTFKEPKSKRWVFGQFDEVVLPATLFLLEKSNVAHGDRGSAVQIARAISALINSKDDDGLLEGKWDGEYADGVSPFDWSGSTAIMDAYLKSGGKPVKYGQCWVFSAVGVTICRALGIPCRSVTNYISAHDTNNSLTVDKFFDVFGNIIENGPQGDCNDSCWNFHVWNDVWMTRPDLPLGYDGWQVIDGTPQELSTNSNTYCCGPTSVKAVKKGDVGLVYDTPFVFSEVNADICNFQEDEESAWGFSRLSINRYHVGRRILTKQVDWYDDVGDSDMWDITSEYKNPEGSEAERLALQSAIRGVPRAQEHYNIPSKSKEDVVFDLIDIDTIPLGQRFEVVVHINNNSSETRTIATNMSASSVYYTGSTAHRLKSAQGTFIVKPGGKEILKLLVKPDDYIDKLTDHGFIKIYAIANVKETKQTWCEEDDFTFIKPELTVDIKDNIRIGENSTFYLRNNRTFEIGNIVRESLQLLVGSKKWTHHHRHLMDPQCPIIAVSFANTVAIGNAPAEALYYYCTVLITCTEA